MRPLALALVLVASAPAFAQTAPKGDTTLPLEGAKQHQEGDYEGVTPGVTQTSEHGHPLKRPKKGTLSWVGFTADAGSGRLFLQAPSEFAYTMKVSGRDVIVTLSGVKRLGRQVRRPLDTRYFDSGVARIAVKRGKHGKIDVHITMKKDAVVATPAARTATEADGYFYLYLDFAGAAGAATEPTDTAPE